MAEKELLKTITYKPPKWHWLEPKIEFKKGTYCYGAGLKPQETLELPNPRVWQPHDEDWKLPQNWKEIILNGIKERLNKYRSFRGSGSGLGADENLEMRLRGGFPRANAVRYVKERYGVNLLACMCAIDRATLPTLLEYWVPGVGVSGVHELVGNALVMKGEKERTTDLRGTPLKEMEEKGV